MNVNNFTEFYSLLKNNDAITNTIPHLRDFVVLAETYRDTCSCDRKIMKSNRYFVPDIERVIGK